MIPPITPSTSWSERYEALRRHVLNGAPVFESQPLSLVVWLAQGMAGWMREWTKAVQTAPSPAVVPRPLPFAATALCQQQLTLLLAQITVRRLYPTACL
jgi:hypothetical protein